VSEQTLVSEPCVEGFDDRVIYQLSVSTEIDLELFAVLPLIGHAIGKP
jgi:hypothetical protein